MKKKILSCIAAIVVLSSFAACGAEDAPAAPASETTSVRTTTAPTETTTASQTSETTVSVSEAVSKMAVSEKAEITIDPGDYLFGGYVALDSGYLDLMSEPDANSDVLADIPYATQLEIYSGGADGWYKTQFNGKAGFVNADFINETESYEEDECYPGIVDHDEVALTKMKDLNLLILLTNVMAKDPSEDEFVKVEDERLGSVDDLKRFISETCSGEAKEKFMDILDTYSNCYVDRDDGLYYCPAGRGSYQFVLSGGVTIVDPAMNYFGAVTNKDDEMNPYGRATFFFDEDHWTIKEYEFGDFEPVQGETVGSADEFLGVWACGRLTAQIEECGTDYLVNIHWSWDAASGVYYEYRCIYDGTALRCSSGGTITEYEYGEDGSYTDNVTCDDAAADFEIIDGELCWTDYTEGAGEPQKFSR